MRFAIVNGKKCSINEVARGTIGLDDWFNLEVVACMGYFLKYWKFRVPHPELPLGYENETEWHIAWKNAVKDEYCEVICGDHMEHRADIKTPEQVIEIQKSPISFEVAKERSEFYHDLMGDNSRLIWVVNAYEVAHNISVQDYPKGKRYGKVVWKYKKRWVKEIAKLTDGDGGRITTIFLDYSPTSLSLLRIWMYDGVLWGSYVKKENFFDKYLAKYSDITAKEFVEKLRKLKI